MLQPNGDRSTDPSRQEIAPARAQRIAAAQQAHTHALEAEKKGALDEALTASSAHLKQASELQDPPTIILGHLTHARLLFKTGRFSETIAHARQALTHMSQATPLSEEALAHIRYTACHIMGSALWRDRQLLPASRALTETTNLARFRFGPGSPEVVDNLFERAFLAIEMNESEATIKERLTACRQEPERLGSTDRAAKALELGTALYEHGLWDAASDALEWSSSIEQCKTKRTLALLTLAEISSYRSDLRALHHYVNKAENIWMDVAAPPRLERAIATLRAHAALAEGDDEAYKEHLSLAQELGHEEELSAEDSIELHFTRAQAFRDKGLTEQAQEEIDAAWALVHYERVSPLSRFKTYLQQSFCAHIDERYHDSNTLINEALTIVDNDSNGRRLLEARAKLLRAHNNYELSLEENQNSSNAGDLLRLSMHDADEALTTFTTENHDPQARIVLLRLLKRTAKRLELPLQYAHYKHHLKVLKTQYPPPER
jgi:hypothetical protein